MRKIKTKKNAGGKSNKISDTVSDATSDAINGNSLDIRKEKIEQLKKNYTGSIY